MELKEALEILGIEEYQSRIFSSNSHGELFHLEQYFILAEHLGKTIFFKKWFEHVVASAEKEWERPESIFQHILKIYIEHFKDIYIHL